MQLFHLKSNKGDINFVSLLQLTEKETKEIPYALGGEQTFLSVLDHTHTHTHPPGDHNKIYRYYSCDRLTTSVRPHCCS